MKFATLKGPRPDPWHNNYLEYSWVSPSGHAYIVGRRYRGAEWRISPKPGMPTVADLSMFEHDEFAMTKRPSLMQARRWLAEHAERL